MIHLKLKIKRLNKFKIVTKLHRQFAHSSAKNLKALLKNAEHLDDEIPQIVDSMSAECETCKRYKKTSPTLVVSLPLATRFNKVVAMDLKKFGDVYFLHLIDLFTRFCKSKVIMRKIPSVIIDRLITEWIRALDKFLIDNGSESDNESYHEFSEYFNVEICATGAQSPWSNRICERNHYVIDVCVQKLREEDPNVNLNVALAWAVNAKNSMMNYNRYSPIQLVLGINPNLPSISSNKLPAMEDIEVSDILRKHLKACLCERIRRALRHPFRATEVEFNQGDKVFYKRDDSNRWGGPSSIIGVDGNVVFIKHGSRLVRVPKCRLVLANSDSEARNMNLNNAQDNILKDNSDHQRHESLNATVEKNLSDKDSSFELKDQCNLQVSNYQEQIAQESGE